MWRIMITPVPFFVAAVAMEPVTMAWVTSWVRVLTFVGLLNHTLIKKLEIEFISDPAILANLGIAD